MLKAFLSTDGGSSFITGLCDLHVLFLFEEKSGYLFSILTSSPFHSLVAPFASLHIPDLIHYLFRTSFGVTYSCPVSHLPKTRLSSDANTYTLPGVGSGVTGTTETLVIGKFEQALVNSETPSNTAGVVTMREYVSLLLFTI